MKKVEPNWLSRVIETKDFHVSKLKENKKWTIKDSAKVLNRSLGSIAEDLKVANWLLTHKEQLEKFETFRDAISFIRDKEYKLKVGEYE